MISTAYEHNGWVEIYDENNNRSASIYLGSGDHLQGFTSATVSIKANGWIEVYDENGNKKDSHYVG